MLLIYKFAFLFNRWEHYMYTKEIFLSKFLNESLVVNVCFVYLFHIYIPNFQKVFLGHKGLTS